MSSPESEGIDAGDVATMVVGLLVLVFGALYLSPKESFLPPPKGDLEVGLILLGMVLALIAVVWTVVRVSAPKPRTVGAPSKATAESPPVPAATKTAEGAVVAAGVATSPHYEVRPPALEGLPAPMKGGSPPVGASATEGPSELPFETESPEPVALGRSLGPSVPFSVAFEGSSTQLLGGTARQVAALRREADEARAQLRDFERRYATVTGPSGPAPPRPSDRPVVEPPQFRETPLTAHRKCAECSDELPEGRQLSLCWTCGRPMCTTCYWRYGGGPEAHRCATCRQRSRTRGGSTYLSGGRAAPGVTPAGSNLEAAASGAPAGPER